MKAATLRVVADKPKGLISIHAAREGGDRSQRAGVQESKISIHAAREGGDTAISSMDLVSSISIHAAREGGDPPH